MPDQYKKVEKYKNIRAAVFVVVCLCVGIGIFVNSNQTEKSVVVAECKTDFSSYDVIEKNIKAKKYKLLLADTDSKREHGLMNVKSKKDICGHDGMIFVFEKAGIQTFWNQNTLVDLDLYWMMGDRVIREDKLLNITDHGMKIYSSIIPVNVVVEIIR